MFGLECSVMLPLVHGTPVLDRRPLLPADVAAAFDEVGRVAWIATPMHLRSLVQSGAALPACAFAIVSTMPLGHALALQSEQLLVAPVLEIYGSTETGALAMRRTARETRWSPLDGVSLDPVEARRSVEARTSRRPSTCSTRSSSRRTAPSRCSAGRPT
jgi:acyl-coenzyme A synthetase/AMP-(fatty) acid ligase